MIPQEFQDWIATPVNQPVEEARGRGGRVIGCTCGYVPAPLLGVRGLVPVRLRAPGASATPMADTYLSSVICSYTRSLLECALESGFDMIDGWVHAGSCDHLRRLYDNLEYLVKPQFHHIIDLPHKKSGAALDWFHDELKRLARELERHFDVSAGDDALSESIAVHNECAALLRDIGDMRKQDAPPISGADFHTLTVAASVSPVRFMIEKLRALRNTLAAAPEPQKHRARLLLVGSQMDDPEYIRIIEFMGGLVVGDLLCYGPAPRLLPIPEGGDPLRTLAEHYLKKPACPRMMEEFGSRVDEIRRTAEECGVHGIVLQAMKFCDCWGVESGLLTAALRDAGLPVLRLEREYALTGEGQLKTRIQAFIESLGK